MNKTAQKFRKKDFQWRIGHPSSSFEMLANAIRKYGIHVYSDPAWKDNSDYAFFISPWKLDRKQILAVSKLFNKEWYEEDSE
jgi:hypothetical protein